MLQVVGGNNTSFSYETHDKDMTNLATFFCLQNFGTLPTICEEYTTIACFQLNYRFKSPPWICPKASNVGKSKKHHNLGTRSLSNNTSRNTWAVCVYMHHVCLLCTTVHAILNVRTNLIQRKRLQANFCRCFNDTWVYFFNCNGDRKRKMTESRRMTTLKVGKWLNHCRQIKIL